MKNVDFMRIVVSSYNPNLADYIYSPCDCKAIRVIVVYDSRVDRLVAADHRVAASGRGLIATVWVRLNMVFFVQYCF